MNKKGDIYNLLGSFQHIIKISFMHSPLLMLTIAVLLVSSTSFLINEEDDNLMDSLTAHTKHCYIANCTSCPITPFQCENCTDINNCCSLNCANCSGIFCSACDDGFYLIMNLCVPTFPCASISIACKTCNTDGDNGTCTECFDGFYLEPQINQCLLCPLECTSCNSTEICLDCIPAYYLDNNTCIACGDFCLNCTNSSECTLCLDTYTVSNGVCVACPTNCSQCTIFNGTATCNECVPSFFLNNG